MANFALLHISLFSHVSDIHACLFLCFVLIPKLWKL